MPATNVVPVVVYLTSEERDRIRAMAVEEDRSLSREAARLIRWALTHRK